MPHGGLHMIEGLRDWNEYVRLLVGLLALINPLTVLPIFLGLVHGRTGAEKGHISTVAALTVLVTLLIFTYLGAALLNRKKGDKVKIQTPGGEAIFVIKKVN